VQLVGGFGATAGVPGAGPLSDSQWERTICALAIMSMKCGRDRDKRQDFWVTEQRAESMSQPGVIQRSRHRSGVRIVI
jgi:hypothetical protein